MHTVLLCLLLCCIASTTSAGRLLAMGDLHGDYDKAVEVLQEMGVIGNSLQWVGGEDEVVQVGDITDRGDCSGEIIMLFERLKKEAAAAGGKVVTLLGNHELMNLQGTLSYVHPDEIAKHGSREARITDYSTEGKYGSILMTYPAVHVSRGNLFVHAGLLSEYASHGVDKINSGVSTAISNKAWRSRFIGPSSPLWTRAQVTNAMTGDCSLVDAALKTLNSKSPDSQITRIVVGHTIQQAGAVNTLCNGRLIATDVALSTFIAKRNYLSYVDLTAEPTVMGRSNDEL
eukprot:TRINITY_DN1072_c2_g1_i1.p1 TRINITY_DN1072_c2_g1~~TRINITY_DN1072_c2_g1_i1.p1  ORF type:complete len:287 (+),score=73.82 TRINITY_DN1072_c2_g1_i1:41-901(+)